MPQDISLRYCPQPVLMEHAKEHQARAINGSRSSGKRQFAGTCREAIRGLGQFSLLQPADPVVSDCTNHVSYPAALLQADSKRKIQPVPHSTHSLPELRDYALCFIALRMKQSRCKTDLPAAEAPRTTSRSNDSCFQLSQA